MIQQQIQQIVIEKGQQHRHIRCCVACLLSIVVKVFQYMFECHKWIHFFYLFHVLLLRKNFLDPICFLLLLLFLILILLFLFLFVQIVFPFLFHSGHVCVCVCVCALKFNNLLREWQQLQVILCFCIYCFHNSLFLIHRKTTTTTRNKVKSIKKNYLKLSFP